MSDIVIRVENLGKSYIIGHQRQERYSALRDVLSNSVRNIAAKTSQLFKGGQLIVGNELEEFWALKDLNFEIKQGDRVGIIGRNGAGKSTLLKVLSRITEPTTGRVTIRGRVASLLEVGTGFHPELTGRENIFLNGAILGMSRVEIKKKFDEIVDFSGVEKFLDTPVKRFSSGMYVRLAFAVAAHLEPEILVVDEVLAVGDAEFQKKCLGKMEDVSVNQGRTVLFVSHNMSAILRLCNNGILMENGSQKLIGKINDVVNEYLGSTKSLEKNLPTLSKTGLNWWLNSIKLYQNGIETTNIDSLSEKQFCIEFEGNDERKLSVEILIKNEEENPLLFIPLGLGQGINFNCNPGKYELRLDLDLPQLSLGIYYVDIFIVETGVQRIFSFHNALSFEVISSYVNESAWTFQRIREVGSLLVNIKSYELISK
jgi:lipopolysaccharide transport system ATP-binding protein